MSSETETVGDVKEQAREKGAEFTEEEWDEAYSEMEEQLEDVSDDDYFVAWAVVRKKFGITLDSDFSVRNSGGSGNGGSNEYYTIQEIKNGEATPNDPDEIEFFNFKGIVTDTWENTKNGVKYYYVILTDDTNAGTLMIRTSSKQASREHFEDVFDYGLPDLFEPLEIQGISAFKPDSDEGDDDNFWMCSFGKYTEVEYPDLDYDIDDVVKDATADVVQEGDLVKVEGTVADYQPGGYIGCSNCRTKYEDTRVCPNCGSSEKQDWWFDTLTVKTTNGPIQALIPPQVPMTHDMPVLENTKMYGTLGYKEDQNEEEYPEVEIQTYDIGGKTEDDEPVERAVEQDEESDSSSDGSSSSDNSSSSNTSDGGVETVDEDEIPELEIDVEFEDDGEFEYAEMRDAIVDQAQSINFEMPVTACGRMLDQQFNVDQDEMDHVLKTALVLVSEDDGVWLGGESPLSEANWEETFIQKND